MRTFVEFAVTAEERNREVHPNRVPHPNIRDARLTMPEAVLAVVFKAQRITSTTDCNFHDLG
jgi:hypothetical protein